MTAGGLLTAASLCLSQTALAAMPDWEGNGLYCSMRVVKSFPLIPRSGQWQVVESRLWAAADPNANLTYTCEHDGAITNLVSYKCDVTGQTDGSAHKLVMQKRTFYINLPVHVSTQAGTCKAVYDNGGVSVTNK